MIKYKALIALLFCISKAGKPVLKTFWQDTYQHSFTGYAACSADSDDDDVGTDGVVDIDERARQYVQSVVGVESGSSSESDNDDSARVESNVLQSDDPDIAKSEIIKLMGVDVSHTVFLNLVSKQYTRTYLT